MRDIILGTLEQVFIEEEIPCPEFTDSLVLLESGLDSLAFAVLVAKLEKLLGFDPFLVDTAAYYPRTLGEFVAYYEKMKR